MATIFNKRIYKILQRTFILVSAVFFGLIISIIPCYADSESDFSNSESVSFSDVVLPITEYLRDKELNFNETSPADAVRATDYAQLIYNYLTSNIAPNQVSIMTNLNGGSSNNEYLYTIIKRIAERGLGVSSSSSTVSWLEMLQTEICTDGFGSAFQGDTIRDFVISLYMLLSSNDYGLNVLSGKLTSIVGNTSASASYSYQTLTATNTVATNINNLNNQFNLSAGDFVGIFKDSFSGDTPILSPISRPSTYVNTNQTSIHALFNFVASSSSESVYSVFIPIRRASNDPVDYAFSINFCSPDYLTNYSYYIQPDVRDIQIVKYGTVITFSLVNTPISNYLLDINLTTRGSYYLYYYGYTDPYFKYIPQSDSRFSDVYNYLLNKEFLRDIRYDVDDLARYIVSPEKQAAENESSTVINEALDSFTGNGSGSAKLSDVSGALQISSGIQSGLNSGGSISNGLSIFNPSNSSFWGWFSQDNAQYFTNNNNRKSLDIDAIPDFLTPIDNEVYLHLGE